MCAAEAHGRRLSAARLRPGQGRVAGRWLRGFRFTLKVAICEPRAPDARCGCASPLRPSSSLGGETGPGVTLTEAAQPAGAGFPVPRLRARAQLDGTGGWGRGQGPEGSGPQRQEPGAGKRSAWPPRCESRETARGGGSVERGWRRPCSPLLTLKIRGHRAPPEGPRGAGGWETEVWTEASVLSGETRRNQTARLAAGLRVRVRVRVRVHLGGRPGHRDEAAPGQTLPFPGLAAGVTRVTGEAGRVSQGRPQDPKAQEERPKGVSVGNSPVRLAFRDGNLKLRSMLRVGGPRSAAPHRT